jgi:Bacterial dnaA protein helix-turn-helix
MRFDRALDLMPPSARLQASVYAINALLIDAGVYDYHAFQKLVGQWMEHNYSPTVMDATHIVCTLVERRFELQPGETTKKTNEPRIVFPRYVAMYLIRQLTNLSYPAIARHFSCHHTTVHHGVEKIEARRGTSPALDDFINGVLSDLAKENRLCAKS